MTSEAAGKNTFGREGVALRALSHDKILIKVGLRHLEANVQHVTVLEKHAAAVQETLKVLTKQDAQYILEKCDYDVNESNDNYESFSVELGGTKPLLIQCAHLLLFFEHLKWSLSNYAMLNDI